MKTISNQILDEERALYNLIDSEVKNCTFAGPKDGESALKECRNILVDSCRFSLRYPLWHAQKYELLNSHMDELTRAALWYSNNGIIKNCVLNGVKALRECNNTLITDCKINSPEFGWKTNNTTIKDSELVSEYLFLESKNIEISNLKFAGKYSFQYCENVLINNSYLDTKDAFWHCKNIVVKDSVVKGEYLGWFSKNLTLINCKIMGTQPLCYCQKLKLVNCTTEGCDLAFEYSDVEADIIGHIDSIKNPKSGIIRVDSVGEIIKENAVMEIKGEVIIR